MVASTWLAPTKYWLMNGHWLVVGVVSCTGAIRMDKPLLLRSCDLMGEFAKMHMGQKSACRKCYNDMSLSTDPVLERASFCQILGLSSYMEEMAVPLDYV